MDVLVTGGAGFIGSRLAVALASTGHRVVVADDLSAYGDWRLLGGAAEPLAIEKIELDIRDAAALDRLPSRRWQRVYHLAASFANARSVVDPDLDHSTNVLGTRNVLEHARRRGCDLFVYAGSSSSYGDVEPPFREDGPLDPSTPYAHTKLEGERLVRSSGLPFAVLRLFNVYGPGDVPGPWRNAIPNMIASLLGPDGAITLFGEGASRDFTFISDVVLAMLEAERAAGLTVNVATGIETPVRAVAESIVRHCDGGGLGRGRICVGERRSWDRVVRRVADISRMRERFGWTPSIRLDEGLAATVAWLRAEELVPRPLRAPSAFGGSAPGAPELPGAPA